MIHVIPYLCNQPHPFQGAHAYDVKPDLKIFKMAIKLAANLSFLFPEKNFLDRFDAAAACGEE